ncbi:hypothetical protein [Streptomyces sp. NPDC089799]|uniref:hypothetical protein n=1 Tax=Streptomyces sp. NPDC089799 TaxID=3155066 RepID=UPI00342AB984
MRDFRSRTKRLGTAVLMTSLALAVPAAVTGTANANPNSARVKVSGTASCERFEDATVTQVTITPEGKQAKAVQLSSDDPKESYSLAFTEVPSGKGLPSKAKVQCQDSDGDPLTYTVKFNLTRPATSSETQTLNLK